jgi:hypothetical protein
MNNSERWRPSKTDPPVYGVGMIAIHEVWIVDYARSVEGESFSCYLWSFFHSAYRVTVTKKSDGKLSIFLIPIVSWGIKAG